MQSHLPANVQVQADAILADFHYLARRADDYVFGQLGAPIQHLATDCVSGEKNVSFFPGVYIVSGGKMSPFSGVYIVRFDHFIPPPFGSHFFPDVHNCA